MQRTEAGALGIQHDEVRAFAALKTKGAVVEGMGLGGFGAHSSNDEYILLGSIVPRLYLVARMVMELSGGAAK